MLRSAADVPLYSSLSQTFTRSAEAGLNLIIETVNQDSPAYKSGVRQGDVIVTVDDWLITLMDRPQVSCQCTFCDASRLFL